MPNRLDGSVCTSEQRGVDAAAYAGSMEPVSTPELVWEHPGRTPMAGAMVIPDPDAEVRWRNWLARGAASDRRLATRTRTVMLVVAAAWAVWFFVQLG
jgi:hypothetical protein